MGFALIFGSAAPQAPLRPCFCLPSPCFSLGSRGADVIEDLRSGEEPERRHLTRSGPAPALRHSSAGPSPWDEHLVLPEERAGPPVRPLSLTSSSALTSYLVRVMSSSSACASCRFCLLCDRVLECPRAHVLSSAPRLARLIPAAPRGSKELRSYRTSRTK